MTTTLQPGTGPDTDFMVFDHGSIIILQPVSAAASEWANACLPPDAMHWGPKGVVIERRYWPAIYEGIVDQGLSVV
jgi:hypothetical protein